jgi:hypothetical protein
MSREASQLLLETALVMGEALPELINPIVSKYPVLRPPELYSD